MSRRCVFELDRPNAVYYSGQTINGVINLTTTTDTNLRHVRIVFVGEGRVEWCQLHAGARSASSTRYTSHEVYINNETFVRGHGVLPAGLHTYTFCITLPAQCPTSCESEHGHIRYWLALILDRPFRSDDVYRKPLTVVQTVNLNYDPSFKLPLLAEEIGSLCCWPYSRGSLMYTLRIPFGGYSPGQSVKYTLCIENQSTADTAGYSLEFTQKMVFTAQSPRRRQRQKNKVLLQQDSSKTCLRLSNRIFEGQFRIPSVSPSNDPSCIIHIEYKLKVTVHMSGCHKSTDLVIPIFIGNIPLRESMPNSMVAETAATQIRPSATEMRLVPPKQDNSSDMPPSYHDLIFTAAVF